VSRSPIYRLRGGHVTHDARCARIPYRGLAALDYPVTDLLTDEQKSTPRTKRWPVAVRLDQMQEGACTYFAVGHSLAARPGVVTGVDFDYCLDGYWGAQRRDPWPGGAYPGARPRYEGTDVNSALSVARDSGAIDGWTWALHWIGEFALGVGYVGPGVIGIDITAGMMDTDNDGFVHPTGPWVGGHAMCVTGIVLRRLPRLTFAEDGWDAVNWERSYFEVLNSWGPDWGDGGMCRLTLLEAAQLFPGGDWAIPTGMRSGSVSRFPIPE
jgi:hypothetical protein